MKTLTQTIPVIDLSLYDQGDAGRAKLAKQVGEGLHEVGFIAIENHGVDTDLVRESYEVIQAMFGKDISVKTRFEDTKAFEPRGFSSMGREHVRGMTQPDLKEFWHVGREIFSDDAARAEIPRNVWPDAEVPAFRPTLLKLYDQLEEAACRVLEVAALHLNLPPFTMCDAITDGNSVLRLAHYPPVPENTPLSTFRSAPHEDIDFITLLCESTAEGLQIQQKDGSWLPVHSLKGQIIVNAGDMLQNLTNGYYRSTTHRVVHDGVAGVRRFSIPYFVHPRAKVSLKPIAEAVARTGGKVLYRDLTAGEYFAERLGEIGFGHKPDADPAHV